MQNIIPPRLKVGDTIGIVCPSHTYNKSTYERVAFQMRKHGFQVKFGDHIFQNDYGTMANLEDRLADFSQAVLDDDIKLVIFSGGQGATELLPHLDYPAIKAHPKLYSSYSDGTSILNAIYAQTGIVTYYGSNPSIFDDMRYYNYEQFKLNFMDETMKHFVSDTKWQTIHPGTAHGILIGGHYHRFECLQGNKYFQYDPNQDYILFLEGQQSSHVPDYVATHLAFIEQTSLFAKVKGVIIGYYAEVLPAEFIAVLQRFVARTHLPLVYSDDFGHGVKHGILPIGVPATLDATTGTLVYD